MPSIEFDAPLVSTDDKGAWTYAVVPDSATTFGTRRPVRARGRIDGQALEVTLLPLGDGTHMLPVKASLRVLLGKSAGDRVHAHLQAV